jgi:hypothetical protein
MSSMVFQILVSLSILLCGPLSWAGANDPVVGQVGLIDGRVLIDSKPVKKGAQVKAGSIIEVSKDGRATLILGKGSVFNLSGESRMIVNEYGLTPGSGEEKAGLELSYGRTRGLILNRGARRDIRIRARAATMGVRGTEIFIEVPKDGEKPIQFFTLEGKADVFTAPNAQAVPLAQNQGVSHAGAEKSGAGDAVKPGMNASQVKDAIKESGLEAVSSKGPMPPPPPKGGPGSGGMGPGGFAGMPQNGMPPFPFDPIQDKVVPLTILPAFCNATSANCP